MILILRVNPAKRGSTDKTRLHELHVNPVILVNERSIHPAKSKGCDHNFELVLRQYNGPEMNFSIDAPSFHKIIQKNTEPNMFVIKYLLS